MGRRQRRKADATIPEETGGMDGSRRRAEVGAVENENDKDSTVVLR
jgi:hypothetical protein